MARIHLSSLGCKLNHAETEAWARRLHQDGHRLVESIEEADVHVVNSCTVTHLAARDSRKAARRGHRAQHPVRTAVSGCYATDQPGEAASLDGVGLVVANADKEDLVERLYRVWPDLRPTATPVPVSYVPLEFGATRGALKVEDGCNMTCAFCIIPSTRGRQRSRSMDSVVAELRELATMGYGEVVVTGVQISSYRDGEARLVDLVRRLLGETDIPRLRLTSIAPWQFDRRLLELWPEDRLCRHFHLSLQSGSNATLRRMRRPYTAEAYAGLLAEIREKVPGVAITTDVIVGFPGESEQEFEESLEFVRACGFARTHVFPYSERPGTLAADLVDAVSPAEKKRRVAVLRDVAAQASTAFVRQRVGEPLRVLWERARGSSVLGTSDNYVRVRAAASEVRPGTLTTVVPHRADATVLEAPTSGRRLPVLAASS